MLEDILLKQNMSIRRLSQCAGVGYNYTYKIVKNQADFDRCGLETAKKLADALNMSLDSLYAYKNSYFAGKIYYQDQKGWDSQDFGKLNAEINKLFLMAIEHHFSDSPASRNEKARRKADMEISCIKFGALSEETRCIMAAILNQQKLLQPFVAIYNNLEGLAEQKPLKETLFLSEEPYNIFPSYKMMNIEY